jgi:asparagine synthase (glutamine-hydrolysing)
MVRTPGPKGGLTPCAASSAADPVNRLLDLDIQTYLTDDILTKVDIASMAHSLEVRCPLVDQELMMFAASLPGAMKLRGLTTKLILREVAKPLPPEKILTRSKQGFGLPVDRWALMMLELWYRAFIDR